MLQPLVQPIFFWPLASLVEVPDLFFQLWVTLETLGNLLWPICCDPVDPAVFRFMFHPRWRDELPVRWVSHGFSKWTCFKLFFNKPRQSVFTERWLSYWKQGISCWHMFLCFWFQRIEVQELSIWSFCPHLFFMKAIRCVHFLLMGPKLWPNPISYCLVFTDIQFSYYCLSWSWINMDKLGSVMYGMTPHFITDQPWCLYHGSVGHKEKWFQRLPRNRTTAPLGRRR